MPKKVFFSFEYKPDNWRVQQVLKMGSLEGEVAFTPQDWESVRHQSKSRIEEWIHRQMLYSKAVVVLVGETTADSDWVDYEIRKAWDDRRPMLGINIHGLKDRQGRVGRKGTNPLANVTFDRGGSLADYVPVIDPAGLTSKQVYSEIEENIKTWVARKAYARP